MSDAMKTLPPVTAAAVVTATVMYPVDVVRALVMANPGTAPTAAVGNFVATHGVTGFLKQGLGAEMLNRTFSRVIKFWAQPVAHQYMFGTAETRGSPVTKGVAGAVATIPEVIAISPFENIKLAEQLDKEKKFTGMSSVVRHLVRTRGLGGLYIGFIGMQFRQGLWTGGFFLTLDEFKRVLEPVTGAGKMNNVAGGFAAGVLGTGLNCWTDVTRTVIQKEAVAATFDPKLARPSALTHLNPVPFLSKAVEIAGSKGVVSGLYAGFGVKAIYLGGSGALLAMLVPAFKEAWGA